MVRKTVIKIANPIIGEEEVNAVRRVLDSGLLAQGPKVAELEEAFAAYCGTRFAVAVNSGTAAIHAALFAAGVREGDEVVTTPFSFIATINPILMLGAKPVLVDIDPATFNIDPKFIEAAITNKTKAIMPVHLYGQPCDFDEIKQLANAHNLLIIEDACQAIGANYKGNKTGGLGDLGCFSLYATKNIMCGEGGIVTTSNTKYAQTIREFRQHGMNGPYEYADLGYNYRMTDIQAAIAVEQLKKADNFNAKRQDNALALSAGLANIIGLKTPVLASERTHVYHQYTVRLTPEIGLSRVEFISRLKASGIGAGIYYPKALHEYPHIAKLGYSKGDFPESEKAAAEVVSLPVHPEVSLSDVSVIVETVRAAANG